MLVTRLNDLYNLNQTEKYPNDFEDKNEKEFKLTKRFMAVTKKT